MASRDYPGSYAELLAWFPDEACLELPVLGVAALAGWLPLPAVREPVGLAAEQRPVGVLGVRPAELGDGGDDVRSRPDAAADVVRSGVDGDRSEARGVSARGAARAGLSSYQTAWAMLHRYRSAMVRPGRERLNGRVEVDETCIGGVEKGTHGRESETKSLVALESKPWAGAAQRWGGGARSWGG